MANGLRKLIREARQRSGGRAEEFPARKNKYHAVRSGPHDSQAEKGYGELLALLVKSGEIWSFEHHPPAVELAAGIAWQVDYLVTDKMGRQVYVEVKGLELADYKLKLKLWKANVKRNLIVVRKYGELRYRVSESHWPGLTVEEVLAGWPYDFEMGRTAP